jgi:hypothetical protein
MMMNAEAERSSLNNRFLDVLKEIQAQRDEKAKLMRQLMRQKLRRKINRCLV